MACLPIAPNRHISVSLVARIFKPFCETRRGSDTGVVEQCRIDGFLEGQSDWCLLYFCKGYLKNSPKWRCEEQIYVFLFSQLVEVGKCFLFYAQKVQVGDHNLNLYVWGWNMLSFKRAYVVSLCGIYIWWYEEQFYGAAQRAGVIPPCLIPQSTHNNQTNTFTNNGEHFPLDHHKQSNTFSIITYETFYIISIWLNSE